jgi:cytochrome P450
MFAERAEVNTHGLDGVRAAAVKFFADPAARTDPAMLYGQLTRKAPVLDLGPVWLVSGFDEVTWLSARGGLRSFPSLRGRIFPMTLAPSLATLVALMLPVRDGADHRQLKGLVTPTFSLRRMPHLKRLIEDSVDTILDQATERGEMDVVNDLALPLPVAISTAMLGIPASDREQVYKWVTLVVRQFFRYGQSTVEVELVEAQLREFAGYVRSLCDIRRQQPGEDLISDLAAAADAGQLSTDELVAYVLLLFMNGLETLAAGLTMAIWELLQHPEERPLIDRDRNRAEAVFEEAIRLHSPVRFSARTLTEDVELDGHRLREGDVVVLFFSAANRDPRHFPDPDRFDPARARGHHIGFGHGAHHCLGASLSLVAGATVLERIARHGDALTTDITPSTAAWSLSLPYTTLESLPVRVAHT